MPPKHNGPNRTLDILSSIGDQEFMGSEVMQNLRDHGLRVERIAISLIRPDAAQSRRVLPETIHRTFHNQEITPVQALKQYIEKVRIIARQKGRPFESLLDLLITGEESDEAVELTPPEQDLRDLTNLSVTLRSDGQVNPLTIVDRTTGAVPNYVIETGERRYWANYIDMEFVPGYQGDGTIPCIILPPGEASVFRQAKENTSRSGLNAIAMARQVALLILWVHGIEPPRSMISNDFYRQALEYDLRDKREYVPDVLSALGGLHKSQLRRYKALLNLSDEAMELADQHSIDEFKLRPVVQLPPEQHYEIVRQTVDFNLTSKDVRALCEEPYSGNQEDTPAKIPSHARRFARSVLTGNDKEVQHLVWALVEAESNPEVVRIRLEGFMQSLDNYLRNL